MSTVYLLPQDTTLPAIGFDVTNAENHELSSQVTDFPVEDGTVISDDVVDDPESFACEVTVTSDPIVVPWFGDAARVTTTLATGHRVEDLQVTSKGKDLVRAMFDRLKDLRKRRALLTVVTSLQDLENMVLQAVSVPRGERSLNWGRFRLTFRQVTIVQTASVTAPKPKEPRGTSQAAKGKAGQKETPDAPTVEGLKKSLLAGAADGDYNKLVTNLLQGFQP